MAHCWVQTASTASSPAAWGRQPLESARSAAGSAHATTCSSNESAGRGGRAGSLLVLGTWTFCARAPGVARLSRTTRGHDWSPPGLATQELRTEPTGQRDLRQSTQPGVVTVAIRPDSEEPIYKQLADDVRRKVASGHLKAGDEIPSARQMAQQLCVTTAPVCRAFCLLQAEGLVERRRGQTMRVAPQHTRAQPAAERIEMLRPLLRRVASEARELELPEDAVLRLFKQLMAERAAP